MTSEQLDALVRHYMESYRDNGEDESLNLAGHLDPEDVEKRRAYLRLELQEAKEAFAQKRMAYMEQLALSLLWDSNSTTHDDDNVRRLSYRLLPARVDILEEELKRLPEIPQEAGSIPVPEPIPESPRVSVLVKEYLAYRDASDPLKANTRLEAVAALKMAVDLLGDPPLASVRNRDAQDFGTNVAKLPKRWRSVYRGKTASEVLQDTEGKGIPRMAPGTFNKEMGLVKVFWRWACTREELPRNVMDAVKPADTGRAKDKRRPFTDAEIEELAPVIEAQRTARPDRYWITTLLAYTGGVFKVNSSCPLLIKKSSAEYRRNRGHGLPTGLQPLFICTPPRWSSICRATVESR